MKHEVHKLVNREVAFNGIYPHLGIILYGNHSTVYVKDTRGLFARIIGKISAPTVLQYINYSNHKPIGRIKYALI